MLGTNFCPLVCAHPKFPFSDFVLGLPSQNWKSFCKLGSVLQIVTIRVFWVLKLLASSYQQGKTNFRQMLCKCCGSLDKRSGIGKGLALAQ